jgi:hypothetical protein
LEAACRPRARLPRISAKNVRNSFGCSRVTGCAAGSELSRAAWRLSTSCCMRSRSSRRVSRRRFVCGLIWSGWRRRRSCSGSDGRRWRNVAGRVLGDASWRFPGSASAGCEPNRPGWSRTSGLRRRRPGRAASGAQACRGLAFVAAKATHTEGEDPGCRGSEAAPSGDHKERRPAIDRRGPSSARRGVRQRVKS